MVTVEANFTSRVDENTENGHRVFGSAGGAGTGHEQKHRELGMGESQTSATVSCRTEIQITQTTPDAKAGGPSQPPSTCLFSINIIEYHYFCTNGM